MRFTQSDMPKKASILGAAKSGLAAAAFLAQRGVAVFISDACPAEKLEAALAAGGCSHIAHEALTHSSRVLDADVIIVSPGVPSDLSIIAQARERGIAVWSEVELAYRYSKATFLAVTGSSGKSTTVSLLGAIVGAAGKEHVVAGNIGLPLVSVAPEISENGIVVAEISSFQLETIETFRPRVAVIVNLLKNHLDRYPDEDAYYNAKKDMAKNMTPADWIVINARDARLCAWAQDFSRHTRVAYFGAAVDNAPCVWFENGRIIGRFGGAEEVLVNVREMKLEGPHNYDNAAAAACAARLAGLNAAAVRAGLSSFSGLPHRLEYVATANGVRYFNDSKSTTAESIVCAITAFSNNVILIAGGRDKGCDFSIVREPLRACVKAVCLIGEAADRMQSEWNGCALIARPETLEDAIQESARRAVPGDVVVFSPGCSSFDMFKNYEHRGECFRVIVRKLAEANAGVQ